MSKLDVFLWLTYCHSEVSRSSHWRCSLRTPRRLLLSFYNKILKNLKNVRQIKVQKRFIDGEKKQSMEQRETNANAKQRLTRVKGIGCFRRGTPSLMFGRILNATLSGKFSTTEVTQEDLELPLLLNSLDSHQTEKNKMKFWTDPTLLLPWRRTPYWVDKAKIVWVAGWWDPSLVLQAF